MSKDKKNLSSLLQGIHEKKLKAVLYKNKYFPNNCLEKKTQLIRKILTDEKESLNIQEENLNSEDEDVIADQLRSDLLDREIKNVYIYNEICDETLSKPKLDSKQTSECLTTIRKPNIRKFFALLKEKKTLNSKQKALKNCLDHIHTSAKPLWTSPSNIMKAVNDCILTRNWSNLTQLLLFMVHLPTEKYKPLIRHLCKVMDKLHPVIQENDLQGQLKLISKAVRRVK